MPVAMFVTAGALLENTLEILRLAIAIILTIAEGTMLVAKERAILVAPRMPNPSGRGEVMLVHLKEGASAYLAVPW